MRWYTRRSVSKIEGHIIIFSLGEGLYNFRGLRAFKEKFNPTWTPRFIAVSGGASLPLVAADALALVSRGNKASRGPA